MHHPVSDSTLMAESLAGTTVRTWQRKIKAQVDHNSYSFSMVGKNPFVDWSAKTGSPPSSSSIGVDIIPVKVTISTDTFDPEATNSNCASGTHTPLSLVTGSPVFGTHSYTMNGVSEGTRQYIGAFQRAEFAHEVTDSGAINSDYDIVLNPIVRPEITLAGSSFGGAIEVGGSCPLGALNINTLDPYLYNTELPALDAKWSTPGNVDKTTYTRLPLFVFTNVVMYQGTTNNCCILGYHSAENDGTGTQTYSVADYESTGDFNNLYDIGVLSHEIGEWVNDPFVDNATPAWGNIGQVSGCQANLEVGDPLTGTNFPSVTMTNGVTYHPQELAFMAWYYRANLTNHWYEGAGGKYSDNGTFTTDAGAVCTG